ncbi:MAG: PQQ-binding-like beta-propeller repeat protein [Rhodopirellula sp.]|nr:PQQ-binding-like beta-propeller repeat protein [Rhodopirellula sp.]
MLDSSIHSSGFNRTIVSLIVVAASVSASADDWPAWRGVNRNAVSKETGLIESWPADGPPLEWKASGIGKGYSSVVVSSGLVFTTGRIDKDVYCFAIELPTGRQRWASRIGTTARNVMATPTVHGDFVYAIDPDGELVCLRVADGEIIWQHSFVEDFGGRLMSGRGYGESPLVDGDLLVCTPGGADAMIVALDRRSGDVIWKSTMPDIGKKGRDGSAFSSIAISHAAGVRQYVQLVGRGLIGIEAETGRFLWGYNDIANQTANIPTPLVRGDFVFSANGYHAGGVLLKIERDDSGTGVTAREVYRLKGNRFQNHHGGFVLIGDHIFGGHGSNNGLPTCLDFETGDILWKQRGAGTGSASVVAADGHLYFHYQDGVVALIEANAEDYRLKGTFKLASAGGDSWSHPVISDGKLFLREQDELSVYNIRGDEPDVPQPAPPKVGPEFSELARLGAIVEFRAAAGTTATSQAKQDQDRFWDVAVVDGQGPLAVIILSDKQLGADGSLNEAVINELRQLQSPFVLDLAGSRIGVQGVRQAAGLKQLVGLNLEVCQNINDATLEPLRMAKSLRTLSVAGTSVGRAGLAYVAELPELVALDLEFCDNVSDESCDMLARMKKLRSLNLRKTAFEPSRISAAGLRKLVELRELEWLNLYGNAITDETLKELKPFEKLQELNLSLTPMSDAGLKHLTSLKHLNSLTLLYSEGFAGPKITNAGLKTLSEMSQLKTLNLVGAKIDDAGVADLKLLRNLQQLTLVGSKISAEGLMRLQMALPDCELDADHVPRK